MDFLYFYTIPVTVSAVSALSGAYTMNLLMHSGATLPTWTHAVTAGVTLVAGIYYVWPLYGIEGLIPFSIASGALIQHLLHMYLSQ